MNFPSGVGFEASSVMGGRGAVLAANSTRPGLHGVSVRVVGILLGLQIRKLNDKHGNANGDNGPVNDQVCLGLAPLVTDNELERAKGFEPSTLTLAT